MSLVIQSLTKFFPAESTLEVFPVFSRLCFSAGSGEFLSIVGPSGCGKTTLLRIIAGLEKASEGDVWLDGEPIIECRSAVGMVFQEYALFPWRTALENVEFGLEIRGVQKRYRRQEALEYLAHFGLVGSENKYPAELSGGMKQRVAIARTLITNPKVVLMDEPFGSLDCQTRNAMQSFLLSIWKEGTETVVFITHNVDEAVFLSDRILVLSHRPAAILVTMDVDLPGPRDRTSPQANEIRKEILQQLHRPSQESHGHAGG